MGEEIQEVERNGVTETVHTYGWYIKKMIRETKEKGAIPVVLSLTPRNEWPNGKVEQRFDTYIKWAKEAATAEDAIYIDLSDAVSQKYQKLGKEKVKGFFPQDHTHTGIEGAILTASIMAELIKKTKELGILRGCIN